MSCLLSQNTNYLHSGALIYLATCEQASTRTDSKSLVNSGPFFLLFWMTSLARYRNVSFLLLLAEEKTLACILNHLAINILLVSMSKMPIYWEFSFLKNHYRTNKMNIYLLAFFWIASVIAIITFFQLLVPHFNNKGRMFTVVNDPERQGLDALLGAAELRQLLLQSRLGEGRHAAVCVCFLLWTRMSPDLVQSFRHQNCRCAANFDTCKRIPLLTLLWLSGWEKQTSNE